MSTGTFAMADHGLTVAFEALSHLVRTHSGCYELAEVLSVQPPDVKKFSKERCDNPSLMAKDILHRWRVQCGENATGLDLFCTLRRSSSASLLDLAWFMKRLLIIGI